MRDPHSALFDCTPSQIPRVYPFPYIAWAPWPDCRATDEDTIDWVHSIDVMETWLDTTVGARLVNWCWTCMDTPQHAALAVAFKWDRDRSLFLLRWS